MVWKKTKKVWVNDERGLKIRIYKSPLNNKWIFEIDNRAYCDATRSSFSSHKIALKWARDYMKRFP